MNVNNNKNKTLTWGDLLLSACRKMFLNKNPLSIADIDSIKDDRNYATYINMAPDIMNEVLTIINNRISLFIKEIFIDFEEWKNYIFNNNDGTISINLLGILKELELETGINYYSDQYLDTVVIKNVFTTNNKNLYFSEVAYGNIILRYKSYPKLTDIVIKYNITPIFYNLDTPFDTIVDLPNSICSLIPLYLASELYKDDDISIATVYRNQFESELDFISNQITDFLGDDYAEDVMGYGY